MHVFIVYAHPSTDSFTFHVKNVFIEGLLSAGHTYELSDLYQMGFETDLTEAEYLREANYNSGIPVAADVQAEQEKINRCDAIAFIYPVFWTEAPAKLVGWFDRVWTYGYAYGERTMKKLGKALVLCVAGRTKAHLAEHGHLAAMTSVMLGDRIFDRAKAAELILLDGMTKADSVLREGNWQKHLDSAFRAGKWIGEDKLAIRTVEQNDLETVYDLHRRPMEAIKGAYKGEGPWDDDLKNIEEVYLKNGGMFVVGEYLGRIVTMGAYKKSKDGFAEIKRMRVYPEHQGNGFGKEILNYLESSARQNGYKGFILETSIHQIGAQKLYTGHGFLENSRETIDGIDCIWYRKEFT